MDDLIGRDDAIKDAASWVAVDEYEKHLQKNVVEWLKELPSAQPKRGKWIHHPEIGWGETWLCDQCGEKTASTVMGKPRWKFCPMCGAKMEVTT